MGHSIIHKINKGIKKDVIKPTTKSVINPSSDILTKTPSNQKNNPIIPSNTTQQISNQVLKPTQQLFNNDVLNNKILDNDIEDMSAEKLFKNKKAWNSVGKSINKTTKGIGSGVKEIYKDSLGLTKDFFGYLRSPQFLAIGGIILVGGIILISNSRR